MAWQYDDLPICRSFCKQMIGDAVIMRNPRPIFSIAALTGAACLIYDHFFSYETMWIAAAVLLALLALCSAGAKALGRSRGNFGTVFASSRKTAG